MTVLITGASFGIGEVLAHKFAKEGHDLILSARTEDKLESLKQELSTKFGIQVSYIALDLSKEEDLQKLVSFSEDKEVEILVNNAGFGDQGYIDECEPEKQMKMIDLNVKALTFLSQAFIKSFKVKKVRGKILNVASVAAFCPGPMMSTYYATKAYVLSFSRAIAAEAAEFGIQVSTLCPGPTHSEFGKRAGVDNSLAFKMAMSSQTVADICYRELMSGRGTIITGLRNRLLVWLMRITPNFLLMPLNKSLFK